MAQAKSDFQKVMLTRYHSGSGMVAGRVRACRSGFTLIEMMIVIGIIAVLVGLLIPVIGMVKERTREAEANQTVSELIIAFELFRANGQGLFPTERADQGIDLALISQLEDLRMWSRGQRLLINDVLVDPWQQPYRYSLTRPVPATGSNLMDYWNWDLANTPPREARWGERSDPTSFGARVAGALDYPYLWSLGRDGNVDDATTWIFTEDGR